MNGTQNVHENVFQKIIIHLSSKDLCITLWFREIGNAASQYLILVP
jgi:hypothetical protein